MARTPRRRRLHSVEQAEARAPIVLGVVRRECPDADDDTLLDVLDQVLDVLIEHDPKDGPLPYPADVIERCQ